MLLDRWKISYKTSLWTRRLIGDSEASKVIPYVSVTFGRAKVAIGRDVIV